MRVLAAVAVTGCLLFAASASASDILIRPGVSIGKLKLGMLEKDARKAYPYAFAKRERRPFGREYIRMSWGLAPYSAILYGPKGRARIVYIYTQSKAERTPQGAGLGTTETQLRALYGARLTCEAPLAYERDGVTMYNRSRPCQLQGTRNTETVFSLTMDPGEPGSGLVLQWESEKAAVTFVGVRSLPQPK